MDKKKAFESYEPGKNIIFEWHKDYGAFLTALQCEGFCNMLYSNVFVRYPMKKADEAKIRSLRQKDGKYSVVFYIIFGTLDKKQSEDLRKFLRLTEENEVIGAVHIEDGNIDAFKDLAFIMRSSEKTRYDFENTKGERLTERSGMLHLCGKNCPYAHIYCRNGAGMYCPVISDVEEKLHDYESIGMAPKAIIEEKNRETLKKLKRSGESDCEHWLYQSHMGGFFFSNEKLDPETLYCEECGDSDWELGEFDSIADAWDALEEDGGIDIGDAGKYKGKVEEHAGGYAAKYVFNNLMAEYFPYVRLISPENGEKGTCCVKEEDILTFIRSMRED